MILTHSSQAELFPGYPCSVFPGPLVPNPRHDPIFGDPDANHIPGQGGRLLDLEAGKPHPYAPHPPPGFPGMPRRRTGGGRSLFGGRRSPRKRHIQGNNKSIIIH